MVLDSVLLSFCHKQLSSFSSTASMHPCSCQYRTVLITIALKYSVKSGRMIHPALFFLFKIVLVICDLSCFHTNLVSKSSSMKNATGILIGIALNLQIVFGGMVS